MPPIRAMRSRAYKTTLELTVTQWEDVNAWMGRLQAAERNLILSRSAVLRALLDELISGESPDLEQRVIDRIRSTK